MIGQELKYLLRDQIRNSEYIIIIEKGNSNTIKCQAAIRKDLSLVTRYLSSSIQQALVEFYQHGPGRARDDTQLAGATFIPIKKDLHFGSPDREGTGGTYGGTGTTMKTEVFIPPDILPDTFNLDADALQVAKPFLKVFPVTTQFHDHQALFPWIYGGLEYIKGKVEFFHKVYNDGFVDDFFRKSKGEHF